MQLIALLVKERAERKILQKDLAAVLGKQQSFIAKVEGGERRLDVAEFLGYAAALGADPNELLIQVLNSSA